MVYNITNYKQYKPVLWQTSNFQTLMMIMTQADENLIKLVNGYH